MPAGNTRDRLENYAYQADHNTYYKVTLTLSVAAAGGFGLPLPNDSTLPRWPYSQLKMRHVYVRTADKLFHDRIPCKDLTQNIYRYGGAVPVQVGGHDFLVTGHKGESYTMT